MEIESTSLRSPFAGTAPESSAGAGPSKVANAAHQFESLLLAELLRAAHGDESGWLGTDEGGGMSSAMGLAEEYLAQALSERGGLGLSRQIENALHGR